MKGESNQKLHLQKKVIFTVLIYDDMLFFIFLMFEIAGKTI